MIELNSLNRKYAIRFTEPAWPGQIGLEDPWQKVEAWTAEGGWKPVEDFKTEEPLTAALAYGPEEKRWSPDGIYCVVTTAKIPPGGRPGPLERFVTRFLDVKRAGWVTFTSDLNVASTDNFLGWKTSEPHTMLIAGDHPGTVEEVHPDAPNH